MSETNLLLDQPRGGPIRDDAEAELPNAAGRAPLVGLMVAAAVLAGLQVGMGFAWPYLQSQGGSASALDLKLNVAFYVSNLVLLGNILLSGRPINTLRIGFYTAGYALIVGLLWPLVFGQIRENLLILALVVLVYGGLLTQPRYLGYLYLFLLSQRFLPAYLFPSFLLTSLLYTTLGPFATAFWVRRERFVPLCHLAGLILLTGLLLPIIYFCTQSEIQDIQQRMLEPQVVAALGKSLETSGIATFVVLLLGVPMAYAMVRRPFPGRGLIDTLIDLPIVVPPPVAGLALLAFMGAKAPFGQFMEQRFGITFFDNTGGIVLAQIFVGSPYLIRASMVAFAAIDERYEHVARTLGSTNWAAFVRVTLPMSLRGILIGVILTWFRAMAEFGSLRIMANRPLTIPILTYERFIGFSESEAQSVAVLILLLCLGVIVGMWIIRSMPNLMGRSIGASDAAH